MPFLFIPIAALAGYAWGTKSQANDALQTAQENMGGLNLTTVAGYALVAGAILYAGKKLIK